MSIPIRSFWDLLKPVRQRRGGTADLGAAVAGVVQELGKAIGRVGLKKAADSLPFKLPFGKYLEE